MRTYSGFHSLAIDAALLTATSLIAVVVGVGLVSPVPRPVFTVGVSTLAVVAVGAAAARIATRPDHLKALQSAQVLKIADRSLIFLRHGLNEETAQEVCRLALDESDAAAVAITDRESVLGFAGVGEDHHSVGGPIITRATHESIEQNESRILASPDEIGCPRYDCLLKAAIVVPLQIRGEAVGTLKFYYTTPRLLNETQITMVEGLARLLSTQLETSELENQTQLACTMELKALQAQINPHFLFNTINTIAMLIRTDPTAARELLREFAAFYRRMLENNEELISLGQELEYALTYLRLEQARFGERLLVAEDVDEAVLDVQVPAFILQPIAENSVLHAARPDAPLTVTITGAREGRVVTLRVADDGTGMDSGTLSRVFEPGFGKGLGIALKNIDDRLKGHYAPGSGLTVESEPGRGTSVVLTIVLPSSMEVET